MKVLVTGAGGFIGAAVSLQLLERGDTVIGVDNLNDYYAVQLKQDRLDRLLPFKHFSFQKLDLADTALALKLFREVRPERVVHLAAQAGVRYSIQNPHAYVDANLKGFMNVLEGCRNCETAHLVYASSSSVYGANTRLPFSVHHNVDHPLSIYAATKKANELMAHTYSHLYQLPVTGLRFFTVYGPWGRPDMSPYLFVGNILAGKPIDVFDQGRHKRDFTYIDDIVTGTVKVVDLIARPDAAWSGEQPDPGTSNAPYRLYNIGNNRAVELLRYIEIIEECTGKKAVKNFLPLQPGDVPETCANIDDLVRDTGYAPATTLEEGMARFVAWYKDYYRVS